MDVFFIVVREDYVDRKWARYVLTPFAFGALENLRMDSHYLDVVFGSEKFCPSFYLRPGFFDPGHDRCICRHEN